MFVEWAGHIGYNQKIALLFPPITIFKHIEQKFVFSLLASISAQIL